MCGIAGIISADPSIVRITTLQEMADTLAHRGPDGEDQWINPSGVAGFGHRWLAVTDLTPAAMQPMQYAGRYTIVFNGEIYNYIELKDDLKKNGFAFHNESDTEVILAMYQLHGDRCLNYFNGMFAFAIWDEKEQSLFCARDRFGEKPFFYHYNENASAFYFASEIKALYAAGIKRDVDHSQMLQFIAHGLTAMNDLSRTLDLNIRKLPAASYALFSLKNKRLSVVRYWQIDKDYRISITEDEALARFATLLSGSVKMRLRSSVSVGASLSGGLDSSSVAALIADGRPAVFKTFTAAFPDFEKDESTYARDVADQCGFENYSIAPSADELMRDLSLLMYHQEEPFTSASVYAQYRVFGLAKENNVVVLLDGQGADETLGGYDVYKRWWLRSLAPQGTAWFLRQKEMNRLLNNAGINNEYRRAWMQYPSQKPVVRSLNDMLYFSTFQSGLEELLRYADRNSMAHGREVRLPFLDHELVSFVFSLSGNLKIRSGWTKWILRKSMNNCLPAHICWNKKKIGFEPPQRTWMENKGLQEFISEAQTKLVEAQILNKSVLQKKDVAHSSYDRNSETWRYLMAYLYLTGQNKKGA